MWTNGVASGRPMRFIPSRRPCPAGSRNWTRKSSPPIARQTGYRWFEGRMAEFLTTPMGTLVLIVAQCLAVVGFVMVSLLFLVYGDRKIWAAVQMRRGPNVVGAYGLLQTVADALKYVVKEVVVPAGADKPVFMLAPLSSFVLAVML